MPRLRFAPESFHLYHCSDRAPLACRSCAAHALLRARSQPTPAWSNVAEVGPSCHKVGENWPGAGHFRLNLGQIWPTVVNVQPMPSLAEAWPMVANVVHNSGRPKTGQCLTKCCPKPVGVGQHRAKFYQFGVNSGRTGTKRQSGGRSAFRTRDGQDDRHSDGCPCVSLCK